MGIKEEKILSRRVEDYLRVIYSLIQKFGYAGTKDIARELGIAPSSVTEMLRRLSETGLVIYVKYKGARLTPQGERYAKLVKMRHDSFVKLLNMLMIPNDIAEKDAHELEHRLHPKTIEQFSKLVDFMLSNPSQLKFLKCWLEKKDKEECKKI